MDKQVVEKYGNQLRVRVCGLLVHKQKIVLVRHEGIGEDGVMWIPPGGGVEFGSSIEKNLKREFLEETGLAVETKEIVCVNEFLQPPLHALELFFKVDLVGGSLTKGTDPEMNKDAQLITDVRFVTFNELQVIPNNQKHIILHNVKEEEDLYKNPPFIHKV